MFPVQSYMWNDNEVIYFSVLKNCAIKNCARVNMGSMETTNRYDIYIVRCEAHTFMLCFQQCHENHKNSKQYSKVVTKV